MGQLRRKQRLFQVSSSDHPCDKHRLRYPMILYKFLGQGAMLATYWSKATSSLINTQLYALQVVLDCLKP